jgi:L-ascorbate metabolism protein UlaG (beta-lactamase superfamily)
MIRSLTYAGHSALFLHTNRVVAAIDPWLETNPRCPRELKEPKQLDLIILTHGHSDHAGDAVRLAKEYGAKVAATFELAMLLIEEGIPERQVVPMNKGGTAEIDGLKVTLTHAFHSNSFDTATGPAYAGEACGVVVRDGTHAIYHAGDTALFGDMDLIRATYAPQIALLPIGDRFTMGPIEAAEAARRIGAKRNIPIHYATFGPLTGTPEAFVRACRERDLDATILEPGASLQLD